MKRRALLTLDLVEHRPLRVTSPEPENGRRPYDGDVELLAELSSRTRPRRALWLGVSLAVQCLVIGAALWLSVTSDSPLPPPRAVSAFLTVRSLDAPPPPPPLAGDVAPAAIGADPPERGAPRQAKPPAPLLAVEMVTAPSIDWTSPALDAYGPDDGAPGGVPGGVPHGAIGGLTQAPESKATAAPAARGPVRVGASIAPPRKLVHVDPEYPAIAATARVEGVIVLEAVISEEGHVIDVHVLKSIPLLDDAAMKAVRRWKYSPTVVGGTPVPIVMTVTVSFALA